MQRARERADEAAAERAAQHPRIDNPRIDNPFIADLKRRWAKGKLTSEAVQSLASNARLLVGHEGNADLDRLGRIGSSGRNPQHLFRDLCKVFGEPFGSPGMDWIEIPLEGKS